MLTITASLNSKNITGMTKVKAINSFAQNVEKEIFRTSLVVELLLDSSAICIPNESESASAKAIMMMPPTTANFKFVLLESPTIKPKVVITPEVIPKLMPEFKIFLTISPIPLLILEIFFYLYQC